MVVIDATTLLLLLRPGTPVPAGPSGIPIDSPKERIEFLIQRLHKARDKIVIPTPALSEALVDAGAAASLAIVERLQKYSVFQIQAFDERAAIEVAAMTRYAKAKGNKRGKSAATWAKVKYDRQIAAIAKVCGATMIYSDDKDLKAIAKEVKLPVVSIADLPLPPKDAQTNLFEEAAGKPTGDKDAEDQGAPGASG